MSNPAAAARLANPGFTETKAKHRHGITLKNPSTGKCCFESQVGQIHHRLDGQEADSTWGAGAAPWQYQMTGCDFHLFALSNFKSGQILKWLDPISGQSVTFQPMALQWTNSLNQIQQISMPQAVTAQVSDDVLYWPAAYGAGRHFKYVASTSKLNKLLILDAGSLPATTYDTLELNFIIGMSAGVTPYIDSGSGLSAWDKKTQRDTVKAIEFRLSNGTVVWSFAVPTAYDSSNDPITGSTTGTMRLKKSGNSLYVSVRFPKAWLDAAQYPVMIDPTVDYQVGATANDGMWKGSSFYGTNAVVAFGHNTNDAYYTFARWPTVQIPAGATIDVAYCSWYRSGGAGTPPGCTLKFVDEANPSAISSVSDGNGRTLTTASITVTHPTSGTWWSTGSIVSILQELVDSYSYASGAAMEVVVWDPSPTSGINYGSSRDYSGSSTTAAKLHIEYTESGYTLAAGSGSFSLSGTPASLLVSRIAPTGTGSFTLSGQTVSLLRSLQISAGAGDFDLAGQDANFLKSLILPGECGEYSLDGQAVSLLASRILAAESGDVALSGQEAALLRSLLLAGGSGEYSLEGQDAALLRSLLLRGDNGEFALTGQDASLLASRLLSCVNGAFALVGQDVSLVFSPVGTYTLVAGSGSFTLTGQAAGLLASRMLACDPGSFSFIGQDVSLLRELRLIAATGTFQVNGQEVTLIYTPIGAFQIFKGRIIGMVGSGGAKGRQIGGN